MSWECVSYWIEHHPGLASWVQAFGSIAAILAAIWISGGDRRYRAKIERFARRDAIDRAIDAAKHAKKIAQNNVQFFSSDSLPRRDMPKYLSVVDHASARVRDVSLGPGMDSEVLGHVSEIGNALVDIRSLIQECVDSHESDVSPQIGYFRHNVERIDRAIQNLESTRRSAQ